MSNVRPIAGTVFNVEQAIEDLRSRAKTFKGLVVLTTDQDDQYDFYIAGSVGAETTLGRIEVLKRALLRTIK